MGESWIVSNLNAALSTWNDKLAEIWSLLTESPQTFKGGQVWGVMTGIHGALQAIGYGLLVLFFAVGVMKTCGSFVEVKKPEHALKLFIRFALAKGAVTYGLELMLAVFSIVQGMVSTIITQSGNSGMSSVTLPQELIDAIDNVGFWDSIPLYRGRRRSPLRLYRRRQRAGRSARSTRKLRTAGYGRFSARRTRRNEANHTKNQEAQMKLNHNKKSVKISLNLFALYAVLVCGVVFALPAFAADDPLVVVENLSTFIFSLIRAVGLILLGWGIVQVGLSLQSHDPSQRSQGFLTLAGGLVITFAKEILDLITA